MYFLNKSSIVSANLDNLGITSNSSIGVSSEFYEIEPGVVLDIILDDTHPFFTNLTLDSERWPAGVSNKKPSSNDPDYTWMGRALIRLLYSQKNLEKENLIWAYPLESNISEFPVLNEMVGVIKYFNNYYYTKKINSVNIPNTNANFNTEIICGGFKSTPGSPIEGNRELLINSSDPYKPFSGPISKLKVNGGTGYEGSLGRYFYFNNRIRSLKRREGDLLFESRFGQSIRFGAYDDNRNNDKGYDNDFPGYIDYKGTGIINPYSNTEAGGGNPFILIRNRQRPISLKGKENKIYDKIPGFTGTDAEKNVGGYILEDINNDGSSIHITAGATISGFVTNCYKKMWGNGKEEQPAFNPNGSTKFKYPKLNGDQIIINSDRIVISAKKGELFNYSKKRYAVVTDDECTIDAHNQVIITTNNKTVINSPAIYLGEYDITDEPVLLGQTTTNWLYDLCNWLIDHTHWYKHTHPDTGEPNPDKTQVPVEIQQLISLRDRLNLLMSRRVFVTGGGFAPGKNGNPGEVSSGSDPVKIVIPSGDGVPGGWRGKNKR